MDSIVVASNVFVPTQTQIQLVSILVGLGDDIQDNPQDKDNLQVGYKSLKLV